MKVGKLSLTVLLIFLCFSNIAAQKENNTLIKITTKDRRVQKIFSKTDTISVYYILADEGQTKATAVKKSNNVFSLNIPGGTIIVLQAGYKNCYGSARCVEILEGSEANNIEITPKINKENISGIRFFPPCVREE